MHKLFIFVCLFSWNILSYAGTDKSVSIEIKPIKISAHTYYVEGMSGAASAKNQGYMSNAGFVVTGAGVIVFDTLGTPALASKLVAAIKKITSQPIRRVIISHYHADHIYGLQVFKALRYLDGNQCRNATSTENRVLPSFASCRQSDQ